MLNELDIFIPVRNPTDVLHTTIDSLLAQVDRRFQVVMSDNHSTQATEVIEESRRRLANAGIAVRIVKPPSEIGRVEHWNWSHRQGSGRWVKPLFVGDWLDPLYIACMQKVIAGNPEIEIIHCSTGIHHADGAREDAIYPGGFCTPAKVLENAFVQGNCFGGPVNICFRREAFDLVGGYPPALPVSADFWLILMIALRHGLYSHEEVLAHFNYHPARFSTNFPMSRINGYREFFVILTAATSYASFAEIPHSKWLRNRLFIRLIGRQVRDHLRNFRRRF